MTKEVDQESHRAAESQGGTAITVDAVTPLAISTSLESGPESSAPLLPSLDDLSTLQEMLGLPDRESSPEEVDDDDDNNGLERLFWIPPDVESPPSGLRPSSPTPNPPPPAPRPRACVLCLRPRTCVLCLRPRACVPYPRPRAFVPCLCLYPRASALQAHTVYPGPLCCFSRAQPAEASQGWKRVESHSLASRATWIQLWVSCHGKAVTLDPTRQLRKQKYIATDV